MVTTPRAVAVAMGAPCPIVVFLNSAFALTPAAHAGARVDSTVCAHVNAFATIAVCVLGSIFVFVGLATSVILAAQAMAATICATFRGATLALKPIVTYTIRL